MREWPMWAQHDTPYVQERNTAHQTLSAEPNATRMVVVSLKTQEGNQVKLRDRHRVKE
jgi:hypothetical protein